MMTRWQDDPNFRGSYSFRKKNQDQKKCSEILRKNLGGRIWLIGEHTHHTSTSCVQGAYQTGQWASKQVLSYINQENNMI